jgi:hypothetical protein
MSSNDDLIHDWVLTVALQAARISCHTCEQVEVAKSQTGTNPKHAVVEDDAIHSLDVTG